MKKKRLIIILSSLFILLFMFIIFRSETYCPLSHKLNQEWNCRICDEYNDKKLVEHFNVDTNELLLSIYSKGKIVWIYHPYKKINNFSNVIHDNTIKFDRKNEMNIIINGVNFTIKRSI